MTLSDLIAWAHDAQRRFGAEATVWLQGQPWTDGSFELDLVDIAELKAHFDPTQGPMVNPHRQDDPESFPVLVILNRATGARE